MNSIKKRKVIHITIFDNRKPKLLTLFLCKKRNKTEISIKDKKNSNNNITKRIIIIPSPGCRESWTCFWQIQGSEMSEQLPAIHERDRLEENFIKMFRKDQFKKVFWHFYSYKCKFSIIFFKLTLILFKVCTIYMAY